MKHRIFRIAILTTSIVILTGLPSQAAKIDKNPKAPIDRVAQLQKQALAYSMLDDHRRPAPAAGKSGIPLGTPSYFESFLTASPGQVVGWTYWDLQQNASMGRMVETGPHPGVTGPTVVHMGWTHLPDSLPEGRTYMYNAYKSASGLLAGAVRIHDPDDVYSGYVNVDVTPDNRALVGGHADEKGPGPYSVQIHFDSCSACEIFDDYVRVEDFTIEYVPGANETFWPKFFYQYGADTVLHVVAMSNSFSDGRYALMYFRHVDAESSTSDGWDFPPYAIDTSEISSYDIAGTRGSDRVAISWMASLPYQEPECDTCSGVSAYTGIILGIMDNDLYYQISNDQGVTWQPRVNLTSCEIGSACDKPYADLSMLFDQSDILHLVWTACPWPGDLCLGEPVPCFEDDFILEAGKLLHWSESIPYTQTICSHTQEPVEECGPPAWALRVAKPTISECDNKLYAVWTQFNSIPEGVLDDCAQWGYYIPGYWGAANGDLWVAGSSDGGMTWSNQYNLTQSYTPLCDPYGAEACQSDYWASMSRYGRQVQTGEDWSTAVIVDPTGSASTDYYLDIQYVNDLDAGAGNSYGEGSWTNNPIKWFRMPCFEPTPCGPFCPWVTPTEIGLPTYAKPEQETQVPLSIENDNCFAIDYEYSIEEDNGPSGWLGVSGLSGTVPTGPNTIETGTIALNKDGTIMDEGWYYGRINLEFSYLGAAFLDGDCDGSIEVALLVQDTFAPPVWDTVNTACLALTVSNNGNMGRDGRERVNMDYYPEDCDSTAKIYMYDGSPFVGRIIDGDTVFSCAVWGVDYRDDFGFSPTCCGHSPAEYCGALDAEVFESGTFATQDSAIAFEKIWVAPQGDCEFIIEHTRVWSYDGAAHDDLMLGEVIDWDVPWDYLADDESNERGNVNSGHIDGPRGLIYQQGYDAHGAGSDTAYPYNCQYNDERFAGNAFVESYLNGAFRWGSPYSGFIGENDLFASPVNEGFVPGLFYQEGMLSGLRGSDSTEDLFSALTYEAGFDLGPTDVYEVVTVLATVQQGTLSNLQAAVDAGKAWYWAHGGINMFADDDDDGRMDPCGCCCQLVGDFDHNGTKDPMDVVALVNWLWRGGPGPICLVEADINCDCSVDPQDAIIYMYWMWRGWPWPGCECSYVCSCP